jgi:hypothetical protein
MESVRERCSLALEGMIIITLCYKIGKYLLLRLHELGQRFQPFDQLILCYQQCDVASH